MNVIRLPIDRRLREEALPEGPSSEAEAGGAAKRPRRRTHSEADAIAAEAGAPKLKKKKAGGRKVKKVRVRRVTPEEVLARALDRQPDPRRKRASRNLSPVEIIAECLDQPIHEVARAIDPVRYSDAWPVREVLVREAEVPAASSSSPARDRRAHARSSRDGLDEFWDLWESHRPVLRGQALRLMGGNMADAEDALSAAMLNAARAYGHAEIRNVRAWFAQLVHNACMDQYRKRRREAAWVDEGDSRDGESGSGTPQIPAADRSPEEELVGREELLSLVAEVLDLPESLLEPLLLRTLRNMPYDEIGEMLGISNTAVRKRVELARKRLREAGIDLS